MGETVRRWRVTWEIEGRRMPSILTADLDSREVAVAQIAKATEAGWDPATAQIEYRDVPVAPEQIPWRAE